MHHPFTSPNLDDIDLIGIGSSKGQGAGHITWCGTGTEIGGGSIRIHSADLQSKMLEIAWNFR